MDNFFTSMSDYFKSRLSNPFWGTLIAVWMVRNWILVYSLFTFDDNFKWKDKVDFITGYFYSKDLQYEIITNIWISLVIMLSAFVVMAMTRWLTNIYDFRILPLTYKYSDSKKLITTERYEALFQLSLTKDQTIESQRSSLDRQESIIRNKELEIESLRKRNIELESENLEGMKEISGEVVEDDKDFIVIKDKIENHIKTQSNYRVIKHWPFFEIITKLLDERRATQFMEICDMLYRNTPELQSVRSEDVDYFEALDLLQTAMSPEADDFSKFYTTELGSQVYAILETLTDREGNINLNYLNSKN